MKVIYIIDSLRRHGTQRFLVHLTRGLHRRGYEQAVINLGGTGDADVTEALRDCGCSVSEIGKGSLLAGGAGWFRLVGQLRRGKPDIVLTLLPVADTLGRPAARVAGCPIILSS